MYLRSLIFRNLWKQPTCIWWAIPKAESITTAKWMKTRKQRSGMAYAIVYDPTLISIFLFFAREGHCWFMFFLWSIVGLCICQGLAGCSPIWICATIFFFFPNCSWLCGIPFSKEKNSHHLLYCVYCLSYVRVTFVFNKQSSSAPSLKPLMKVLDWNWYPLDQSWWIIWYLTVNTW